MRTHSPLCAVLFDTKNLKGRWKLEYIGIMPSLHRRLEAAESLRRLVWHTKFMATLGGLILVIFIFVFGKASAMVVLVTSANETFSYSDVEATFAPHVPADGITGVLQAADPINACSPLSNQSISSDLKSPFFVIAIRGTCTFDAKVRVAQDAGYSAIIIFDNEDGQDLISKFHVPCVDHWLIKRRPFCPICKRDAHINGKGCSPSETSPLLPSVSASSHPITSSVPIAAQASPVEALPRSSTNLYSTVSPVGSPSPTVACSIKSSASSYLSSRGSSSSIQRQYLGFYSAPDTFLQVQSCAEVHSGVSNINGA